LFIIECLRIRLAIFEVAAMGKREYLTLARQFLEEARGQAEDYRKTGSELALRQACEKGWGAVAQALMSTTPKPIETQKEFGLVASDLFRKTGEKVYLDAETAGEYLHSAGFYHGLPTVELVSRSLDLVDELLKTLERSG